MLLAHPVRQHAHQLARALEQAGFLLRMYTLLPSAESVGGILMALMNRLPSFARRLQPLGLPRVRIRTRALPLVLLKSAEVFRSASIDGIAFLLTWTRFDRWVAKRLLVEKPDIVVGYETCCAETFRAAKKIGAKCVLDCAAFHYRFQDAVLREGDIAGFPWWEKKIRQRKEEEIELADKIICVSEFAAESYRQAGVPREKIAVNTLGCDVGEFALGKKATDDMARFCFVGAARALKGTDVLLEAFHQLNGERPNCQLHFFGSPYGLTSAGRKGSANVQVHGKLSHTELARRLPGMDCLILPSLLDSFGMVVLEALACGTYVIASDMVGAKTVLTPGMTGEIVPAGNVSALYLAMKKIAENLPLIRSLSGACRDTALQHDWSHYHKHAVAIFKDMHVMSHAA